MLHRGIAHEVTIYCFNKQMFSVFSRAYTSHNRRLTRARNGRQSRARRERRARSIRGGGGAKYAHNSHGGAWADQC